MATPNIEDFLFAVQRNNELKNCLGSDLADNLQDGDLLAVTRGNVTYKLEVEVPTMPWEGHVGGIWHVKNASDSVALTGGPFPAWDVDGSNERQITSFGPTEELVFLTSGNASFLFKGNRTQTWEFGDITDTSSVTNMMAMFDNARVFNSDIIDWDTSSVTNMGGMFADASTFNGNIGNWNVGSVEDMNSMFMGANAFNQNLNKWDVSNVITTSYMFALNPIFDGDISNWNLSNVQDTTHMFNKAVVFNQDISTKEVTTVDGDTYTAWNMSNVKRMNYMLAQTKEFDQDIGNWDVSNVTNMQFMFLKTDKFNQDIGNWDVSNVTDMQKMFEYAAAFNQDLSNWCVNPTPDIFRFDADATSWTEPKPCWGHCPPQGDPCPGSNIWDDLVEAKTHCVLEIINCTGSLRPAFNSIFTDLPSGVYKADGTKVYGYLNDTSWPRDENSVFVDDLTGPADPNETYYALFPIGANESNGFGDSGFNDNTTGTFDLGPATDTTQARTFSYMFAWLPDFNGDVSALDTSNVESMHGMFTESASFNNSSVVGFDTSNVTNMDSMFDEATSFDQDISQWCVKNITSVPTWFAYNAPLTSDHTPGWGGCPAEGIDPPDLPQAPEISVVSWPTIDSFGGNNAVSTGTTAVFDIVGDYLSVGYKWEYKLDTDGEWDWNPDWTVNPIEYDNTATNVEHTYDYPANTILARLTCFVDYEEGEWVVSSSFSSTEIDVTTGQPASSGAFGVSRSPISPRRRRLAQTETGGSSY